MKGCCDIRVECGRMFGEGGLFKFVSIVPVGYAWMVIIGDQHDEDEMRVGCKNEAGEPDELYVLYTRYLPRFEAAARDAAVGTSLVCVCLIVQRSDRQFASNWHKLAEL